MNSKKLSKKIDGSALGHDGPMQKFPGRDIPDPIAREVRQRCGFGCVICGLPLYTYEHMNEWALVKRHVADEITLLCDFHHREKTNGLLSREKVHLANMHPKNQAGTSAPYQFHAQPSSITVKLGSNSYEYNGDDPNATMVLISIAAEPILWFKFSDDNLLLNLSLYDESDKLILSIRDNQMIQSTEIWDIRFVGTTLTIQAAARDIMLELVFAPNKNLICVNRAKLRRSGYEINITEQGATAGPPIVGCTVRGEGALFNFGEPRVFGALVNYELKRKDASISIDSEST